MSGKGFQIAVIPGDGSGPEIVDEGIKVMEAAVKLVSGLDLEFTSYPAGADHYTRTGVACPPEVFDACQAADAIYKGPIGLPDVRYPDGTELNVDILLRIGLDLYANVRPIKLRPGASTVLAGKKLGDIDYVVIRENSEGAYATWAGEVAKTKTAKANGIILREEVAADTILITRTGTARAVRHACQIARQRNGAPADGVTRVTCVDKSNVLKSYAFFRKVYDEVLDEHPDIERHYEYIDAVTQSLVKSPEHFDVIVAENLFGDIITDLGAATVGSIGLGASANIGERHAMFEPIHGSAPDLAGKSLANPIGQILSGKMMLEWLGTQHQHTHATEAANVIESAVDTVLREGLILPGDLGGKATTTQVGDAIVSNLSADN